MLTHNDGLVLVFDVSIYASFDKIKDWIKTIKECDNDIPIFLLGNKIDLVNTREVKKEDALALNINYHEISAREGTGLKEACIDICRKCTNMQ